MKKIKLTQGKFAIVDDADFDWLSRWKWYAKKTGDNGSYYAASCRRINGRPTTFYMHRVITNCPVGMEVDHQNKETLNNRRQNISIMTKRENLKRRYREEKL